MVTITNNNIYCSNESISALSSIDDADIIDPSDILLYFADDVELGENVTFKRLFDIVSHDVAIFNDIFYVSLDGNYIEPFLQEIENNNTEKYNFNYIEVCWICNKYDNNFNLSPSIYGVSDNDDVHTIDLISLNNIKDFRLVLNEKISFVDYDKMLLDETKNETKIGFGNRKFTLFELFSSIFSEISCYGGPFDKIEVIDNIKKYDNDSEMLSDIDDNTKKQHDICDIIDDLDSLDDFLVKYDNFRDRVDEKRLKNIKNLDALKICLLDKIKIYDNISKSEDKLNNYYKKLTDIEYNIQLLYGEKEDKKFHKFWETPKCTCPKIDNIEMYPSNIPFFDSECPIHKKLK